MDNAAANKSAGQALEEKYPNIFFNKCAAHGVDLMIEQVSKLEFLKKTIDICIGLDNFLRNHSFTKNYLGEFSNKTVIKPGATRF